MDIKRKHKGIVSFEDEIINKEQADNILSGLKKNKQDNDISSKNKIKKNKRDKMKKKDVEKCILESPVELQNDCISTITTENEDQSIKELRKRKKKKKNDNLTSSDLICEEENIDNPKKKKNSQENNPVEPSVIKKTKKRKHEEGDEGSTTENTKNDDEEQLEVIEGTTVKKATESKRSLKRKKYLKLIEDRKLKADLKMQEGVFNYLSKWKHARNEWKFEKLKQIWLQQNLFVVNKIPDEFWSSSVEYFNGSKGAIRQSVIKDALKIIEEEDKAEETNEDQDYQRRLNRARDIIQSLEE